MLGSAAGRDEVAQRLLADACQFAESHHWKLATAHQRVKVRPADADGFCCLFDGEGLFDVHGMALLSDCAA
jgi:hypothetical protein